METKLEGNNIVVTQKIDLAQFVMKKQADLRYITQQINQLNVQAQNIVTELSSIVEQQKSAE
jgi:hypothetical protein